MAKPRISVVMAVYQGERYLSEAIESILFQTEPSFEFIIVDDASSDRSMEILKRYECTDKRIVIIRNEKNLGLGASLRVGSEAASGEYLARMDCDDLSPKNRFELQLEYLERHPEISILGGNHRLIDENGTDFGLLEYPNSSEIMRWNMLLGNGLIVSNGATMMRRDYLFQLGNYRDLRAAQDFELWSRTFAEKPFPIANIKEIVLCYRQHTGTITKKNRSFQEEVAVGVRIKQIEGLLNNKIDPDIVWAYRHPGSFANVKEIIKIWIEIYYAFFRRFAADAEAVAAINSEFLQRLGRYIYFNPLTKDKVGRVSYYSMIDKLPPKMRGALLANKRGITRHEEVLVEI